MIFKNITLVVLLLLSQKAFSQIKFLQQEKDQYGNIIFVKLDSSEKINSNKVQELFNQIILPSKNITHKFLRSFKDNENYTHSIYQAFYDTLEIHGMGYVVHTKNDFIEYANGYLVKIEKINTTPLIDKNYALKIASQTSHSKISEDEIKETKILKMLLFKNKQNKYVLTYKILIENNISTSSCFLYLDAHNGEILYNEPLYCSSHNQIQNPPYVVGNAQTKYSGNQTIVTDSYFGLFRLRELRDGVNIITRNALNSVNESYIASFATDFIDGSNTWTLSNQGPDQPATDVHWGSEKVLDYWKQEQGRNSINGLGMDLLNYVHYGSSFSGANAYWTGTNSSSIPNSMLYGDGNNSFKSFTSLDICAHEIGHGICQFTAGLLGGPAESGALNEGFSDIWCAVIEGWAAPTKQKWLLAEEIVQIPNKTCIRNMQNPKDIQQSSGQHPNTYGGQFWDAQNLSSHNNSLILSHWFYILSEGKSGINDLNNSYNVSGIGINKAAKIAYMTEQNLSPFDSYSQTRWVSIQVTRNYFGIGSCEEIEVTNSWYAVGVGAAYQFTNPNIDGPSQICNSGSLFSIGNIPCNSILTWSVTSLGGAVTLSNTTGNTTSINIPSTFPQSGTIVLTATIAGIANPITKIIHYGQPFFEASYSNGITNGLSLSIFNPGSSNNSINNVCLGYGFPNVYVDAQAYGASNVIWSLPIGGYNDNGPSFNIQQVTGNKTYFGWSFGGTNPIGYLQASVSNSCGSFSQIFAFNQVNCGTQGGDPCEQAKATNYFTISPNPANDVIKVGVTNRPAPIECNGLKAISGKNGITFSVVNIYNNLGTLVNTYKTKNAKSATIQIGNLKAGSYLVEIIQGDYVEKQQIIVQK